MQFGVWTIRELRTYSWCDMSNKIKRKPEINLIAIAVDQLSVFFSIISKRSDNDQKNKEFAVEFMYERSSVMSS